MYNQYHSCGNESEFIPHRLRIHKIMRGSIQKKMQIQTIKVKAWLMHLPQEICTKRMYTKDA